MHLEKEIVETLQHMNRDLVILMKTNHYLRSIDVKLGNPTNTFTQVNNMTWNVYKKTQRDKITYWQYCKRALAFYYLKFGLFFMYLSVSLRRLLGF